MTESLYTVLTEAINAMAAEGYQSPEQLQYWLDRIRASAEGSLMPSHELREKLNATLTAIYRKQVDSGAILAQHAGVSRFGLEKVKPHLRAELDKRIMASANLIKLNREQSVEKTLQRFSGWATSIPASGAAVVNRVEEKDRIRKSMSQLPFEERRVLIDQGHKLTSSLSNIIAMDNGAIAGVWRSNWRQKGYNYRCRHKERDMVAYPVRDNWAMKSGLMCKGGEPYTDEIEQPAEWPFCRCYYRWVYNLRGLPDKMITAKGRAKQEELRAANA